VIVRMNENERERRRKKERREWRGGVCIELKVD
jgi:hypothetical protein